MKDSEQVKDSEQSREAGIQQQKEFGVFLSSELLISQHRDGCLMSSYSRVVFFNEGQDFTMEWNEEPFPLLSEQGTLCLLCK